MLGEKIRHLRKEKGLSLGELALRADCAKSYLSDIERGIRDNPSIQFIEKIAHVLGVTTEFFFEKQPAAASVERTSDLQELLRELDFGWLQLTKQAAESGVSKAQFREFVEYARWKASHQNKPDTQPQPKKPVS